MKRKSARNKKSKPGKMKARLRPGRSWLFLRPGDQVFVVAPGSASNQEDVRQALAFLRSLELVPIFEEASLDAHHPFHSNTDGKRFEYLKNALSSKEAKAIWCLRGGYGSLRLLPMLKKMAKPNLMKLLIGYSDITSLHLFLNQNWGWPSLHGPLLENGKPGRVASEDIEELRAALFGEIHRLEERLLPINGAASVMKPKKAVLTGGNLAVLAAHAGTPFAMNAKGKIVVLEDIGERGYRLDRLLEQLKQSGAFTGALAIVFGDFLNAQEKDGRDFSRIAIERFAEENKIPCFQGIKLGHGARNRAWFFNTPAVIQGGRQPGLIVETSGVIQT